MELLWKGRPNAPKAEKFGNHYEYREQGDKKETWTNVSRIEKLKRTDDNKNWEPDDSKTINILSGQRKSGNLQVSNWANLRTSKDHKTIQKAQLNGRTRLQSFAGIFISQNVSVLVMRANFSNSRFREDSANGRHCAHHIDSNPDNDNALNIGKYFITFKT